MKFFTLILNGNFTALETQGGQFGFISCTQLVKEPHKSCGGVGGGDSPETADKWTNQT